MMKYLTILTMKIIFIKNIKIFYQFNKFLSLGLKMGNQLISFFYYHFGVQYHPEFSKKLWRNTFNVGQKI